MSKRNAFVTLSALVITVAFTFFATPTRATGGHVPVPVCHHTGSGSNPYVSIVVDVHSVGTAKTLGGHSVHSGDIWPAYSYNGVGYPAHGDQSILANGCHVPPTQEPTEEPTQPPTQEPTESPTKVKTQEPTLVVTAKPMDPEADVCVVEDVVPDGAGYTLHGPVAGRYHVDKLNPGKAPVLVFGVMQLSKDDIVTVNEKDYIVLPSENPRIWRCVPIEPSNQPAVKDCNLVYAVRGSDAIYISATCDPIVSVKVDGTIVYHNPHFGNERIRVPASCTLPSEVWVNGKLFKSFKPTCNKQ